MSSILPSLTNQNDVRFLRLGDVVRLRNGSDHKTFGAGSVPVYGSGGIMRYIDTAAHPGPSVLIPRKGSLGNIFYVDAPFWTVDTIFYTEVNEDLLVPKYFYYVMVTQRLEEKNQAGGVPSMTQSFLNELRIPVPPLEIQREVVRVLDPFTQLEAELEAELEARQKQYNHYRRELLAFGVGEANVMTLGDIGPVAMCKRVFKAETSDDGEVPFYKIGTFGRRPDAYISAALYDEYRGRYPFPKIGDVLLSAAGTIGRAIPYDGKPAYFQDSNIVWIDNDESIVTNAFLYHWYQVIEWTTDGGTIKRLYNENLRKAKIAVPPKEEQNRIVEILDKFDTYVNDPASGLLAEIMARRKQYEYYRDKLLTFSELA